MSKWQISGPYLNFINKIRQLKSAYQKGQKQKQMQSEQQLLSNDELFKMSVELLKENLQMDQLQFQQFETNEKFRAYIRSIESIGLTLSKFYQEKENDVKIEIKSLKDQNRYLQQKLANHMELNQSLNEQLEYCQLQQAQYDQKLNKSQHEIEHGKHFILTQINAKEMLAQENMKINTRNHQLLDQISKLKQINEILTTQNYEGIKKIELLHFQLSKFKTLNDKVQHQKNDILAQKKALQAQIKGLNLLLEQKDYLLGNKPIIQCQSYENFAQIRERFLSSTVRVVREENEQVGSDKQVMKDIEQKCYIQPILALKFSDSRSISKKSEILSTSIKIQNNIFDDLQDNYQESPENYGDHKLLKTDRKRKESTGPKQPFNKSCDRVQQKNQINSVSKILFVSTSPKVIQKTTKGLLVTDNKKKQQGQNLKSVINLQRNYSEQNNSKIKNRKLRSNASVVLRNTKSKVYHKQSDRKKAKIQHSQSVEDLYGDNISKTVQIEVFQRELYNKEKIIQNLKFENRSVRQMVLEQSEKRTEAEYDYEQKIDKLQSEVKFYKDQMKIDYIKYVEEKAFSESLRNQLLLVSEQVHNKEQGYEKVKNQLKQKCKQYIQESIAFYRFKYEQMEQKMRNMELAYLNSKKDLNDIEDELQKQQNPKQLKKSKSNSLFYKQVKHHSYNASQEYSEINNLSANHSKSASFANIDNEEAIERKQKNNQNILIYDCGEDQMEEGDQNLQDLCSYHDEKQLCETGIQTEVAWSQEDSSYKISLEYSKMQQVQDSSQISYDFSSLGLKSSQEISKIRIFMQERAQKIKRLSICPIDLIVVDSDKQFISEFNTGLFSPRAKDTSYLTADQSQLYKMKQSSPFCLQKAFAFTIDQYKVKSDHGTCTKIPKLEMAKSDSVCIKPTLKEKNIRIFETVTQMISPVKKSVKNADIQHDLLIFESFWTQTLLAEVQTIGIQFKPQFVQIATQTMKQALSFNKNLSFKYYPDKKQVCEFATQKQNTPQLQKEVQINPLLQESAIQTLNKSLTLTSTISQIFNPQIKTYNQVLIQTKQYPRQIVSHVLSQKIYPTQRLKNDHHQSFIEEHISEVIIDMSQSFEMSELFIQTLKTKLLQVNENLKQLQAQKHNDSSSSSSNGVEKIFNSISIDVDLSIHQKNLSVKTIPKFNVDLFQGNVHTSKVSTIGSVSTSLSFQSPYHREVEQGKLKVPQFQQILEIESENVESFTIFEAEKIEIDSYNDSQYKGSVNRSPQQDNSLNEQQKIEAFREVQELDGLSGKKYEESTRKIQRLLDSPKNHIIKKQKILSLLDSPKCKLLKNGLKIEIQKPKQLFISDKDFDLIRRRFKVKRFKLVQKKQQKYLQNVSTDASEYYMYHHLSSLQLMVVFCKQVQRKNSINGKVEIIVLHESRVMSLTQNYEFQASKVFVSYSGDLMIFGNQEITFTENQLKFSLNNKVNHFVGLFPSYITQNHIESIKQKQFQVLNMFKYKFR